MLTATGRLHDEAVLAEIAFLHWLDAEVAAGRLHDEAVLADKLYSLRQPLPEFTGRRQVIARQ